MNAHLASTDSDLQSWLTQDFTIALADELVTVIRYGRPTFRAAEDAITLSKES